MVLNPRALTISKLSGERTNMEDRDHVLQTTNRYDAISPPLSTFKYTDMPEATSASLSGSMSVADSQTVDAAPSFVEFDNVKAKGSTKRKPKKCPKR